MPEADFRRPRSPAELAAALLPAAAAEFLAPAQPPYLIVALDDGSAADAESAWLLDRVGELPCPLIGVGQQAHLTPWSAGVDVRVAPRQLDALCNQIERHPLASAVLVQLLRHNERTGIEDGLFAESLAYGTLHAGADFRSFLAGRPVPQRSESPNPILLRREGDCLHLTLNRPEQRNAYSAGMRDALFEALMLLDADPDVRMHIDGAGDCFCIGGDLTEFGLAGDPPLAHSVRMIRSVAPLLARHAGRIECRVHRACIGSGIELPAFAGRLVARDDTYFQLPELTMGLIPGAGGTVSLLRRIGRQKTAYLALSGRRIDARTALDWGLIDAIE